MDKMAESGRTPSSHGRDGHGHGHGQSVAFLDEAVAWIQAKTKSAGLEPRLGLVLGSGLGSIADEVADPVVFPFSDLPHAPMSTVAGHNGKCVLGRLRGVDVAVMQGRVHLYEGYSPAQVVFLARVLARLGVGQVLLTNAAGSINASFAVPGLMLLRDHLNLTGTNPLVGPNEDALGPRFPDMTSVYDPVLSATLLRVAKDLGVDLREGTYAGVLGPSYETPAEIRMLRTIGADAVGMSTVLEAIALRHMGARVAGVSCLSNLAAGLGSGPLSHAEVEASARAVQAQLTSLVVGFAEALDA